MPDSILIVEDDQDIAELIKVHMEDLGLQVTHCDSGEDAIKEALENDFSLLILDITLPGCSGLDVCRKVREGKQAQAILMLTSRTSENNNIENSNNENSSICHGQLMINQRTHEVVLREKTLDLTSTEFDLLRFMAQHPNQVFSRTQLLDKVWGYQHSGYEHTVNSHINRLRNKLVSEQKTPIKKALPAIIQTVFGVGYKFNPEGAV